MPQSPDDSSAVLEPLAGKVDPPVVVEASGFPVIGWYSDRKYLALAIDEQERKLRRNIFQKLVGLFTDPCD